MHYSKQLEKTYLPIFYKVFFSIKATLYRSSSNKAPKPRMPKPTLMKLNQSAKPDSVGTVTALSITLPPSANRQLTSVGFTSRRQKPS